MSHTPYIELCADDPAALAAFYEAVLGWKSNAWAGTQPYWLLKAGEGEDAPAIGGMMHRHFAQPVINTFEVESLEETTASVEANGGKVAHGPNEIPNVGTHVYCEDPEGTLFGLLQPRAD